LGGTSVWAPGAVAPGVIPCSLVLNEDGLMFDEGTNCVVVEDDA